MSALRQVSGIAIASLIASASLSAQVLLNDNFDSESGGRTQLVYSSFSNWTVSGNVDLVSSPNGFGMTCSGSCVDLDGTRGAGSITTRTAYSFLAGDVMKFQFDVSGNQRRRQTFDQFLVRFGFTSPTTISNFSSTSDLWPVVSVAPNGVVSNINFSYNIGGSQPFGTWSYAFKAITDGSVRLTLGTTSADNVGPVVDNVLIEKTASPMIVVSEPASFALLGAGLLGLVAVARRRKIA